MQPFFSLIYSAIIAIMSLIGDKDRREGISHHVEGQAETN